MSQTPLIIAQLQQQLQRLERGGRAATAEEQISSGCPPLDRLLPSGGFQRGWLVEWLGIRGGGAGTLALWAAREAARDGGSIVVVDRRRCFYPPAAAAWGLEPQRLIVVWPDSLSEQLWALDQSLRCPAVAAVWAPLERLDQRWFRRWQLAAEQTGTLALLLRPTQIRGQPSWADVQLAVSPCRATGPADEDVWRLRIEITRCRGAAAGRGLEVEVDGTRGEVREVSRRHETLSMSLATSLARAAVGYRKPSAGRAGAGGA